MAENTQKSKIVESLRKTLNTKINNNIPFSQKELDSIENIAVNTLDIKNTPSRDKEASDINNLLHEAKQHNANLIRKRSTKRYEFDERDIQPINSMTILD
jgi:hypothetical protein